MPFFISVFADCNLNLLCWAAIFIFVLSSVNIRDMILFLMFFSSGRVIVLVNDRVHVLVADAGNARIAVAKAADGSGVGSLAGPAGTLVTPRGVAIVPRSGQVVVCDATRHLLVVFASATDDTVVRTLCDNGGRAGDAPSELRDPHGVAILNDEVRVQRVLFATVCVSCLRLWPRS